MKPKELIMFWWDFAKQGINLASEITPKGTKINRSEAIKLDFLTASILYTFLGEFAIPFGKKLDKNRTLWYNNAR